MTQIVYKARSLYTPVETLDHPLVVVKDGAIVKLVSQGGSAAPSNTSAYDFGDDTIVPGFVDIHIHGSAGYDVMQKDQVARCGFEQFLARHGVTAYYPTTVAAP